MKIKYRAFHDVQDDKQENFADLHQFSLPGREIRENFLLPFRNINFTFVF